MEKKNKIIKKLDDNFVEHYDDIIEYKNNMNDILYKIGLKGFNSYNEFCMYIRNNAILKIKKDKIKHINSDDNFFSEIMNKTLRDKIRRNRGYEKKILSYFSDSEIIDILKSGK